MPRRSGLGRHQYRRSQRRAKQRFPGWPTDRGSGSGRRQLFWLPIRWPAGRILLRTGWRFEEKSSRSRSAGCFNLTGICSRTALRIRDMKSSSFCPDHVASAIMPQTQLAAVKALFFDVFGTLVDWRTSVGREAKAVLEPLGHHTDWLRFADAWRNEYQPGMEEVRAGRIPFSKLGVLHRRNLERILPRFGFTALSEEIVARLNAAWHRLHAWAGVAGGAPPL